jgi:hypothetical protein
MGVPEDRMQILAVEKEKVKLTLCLIKQNTIRACGGVEFEHHPFLLSA